MSAYMVTDEHIDALLTAGLNHAWNRHGPMRWVVRDLTDDETAEAYQAGEPWGPGATEVYRSVMRQLTRETVGYVGALLLAENRRSVDFRYSEEEIEQPYAYRELPGYPDPVTVLKAIDCLEYQSCEHPGWQDSEARRFLDALRKKAIGKLAGYDEAEAWEVVSRQVFMDAARRKAQVSA